MLYILLFVILLILVFGGSFFGAPWIPTPRVDYARIEKLSNLRDGQSFYDLGCGFGGLLFFLAQNHPAVKIKGVEIAIIPYIAAKIKAFSQKNVTICFGDIKQHDISDADVVFMFLTPETHRNLKAKIIRELKPQAKVITACWGFDYDTNGIVDKTESNVSYFAYTAGEIIGSRTPKQ